jgi:hypothetical protein
LEAGEIVETELIDPEPKTGVHVRIQAATVERTLPQRAPEWKTEDVKVRNDVLGTVCATPERRPGHVLVKHWLYCMPVKRWYRLEDVEIAI